MDNIRQERRYDMIESECKYKSIERFGLYIMVFIAMISSCQANTDIDKAINKIDKLEKKVELVITINESERRRLNKRLLKEVK